MQGPYGGLSLYLDERRGVQGNTSMRLREFPRAQPEGTPKTFFMNSEILGMHIWRKKTPKLQKKKVELHGVHGVCFFRGLGRSKEPKRIVLYINYMPAFKSIFTPLVAMML